MTIRKRGGRHHLVSKKGKTLGRHSTKAGAEKQEAAINISKAKKAGHVIPKKRGR